MVSPHEWLLPTVLDNDVAPLGIILFMGLTQVRASRGGPQEDAPVALSRHIGTPWWRKTLAPCVWCVACRPAQGHLISTLCMHAPGTLLPTQQWLFGPVTSFAISLGAFIGSFANIALATRFQA